MVISCYVLNKLNELTQLTCSKLMMKCCHYIMTCGINICLDLLQINVGNQQVK